MELRTKRAAFSGFPSSAEPFIAVATRNPELPSVVAKDHVLVVNSIESISIPEQIQYRAVLTTDGTFTEQFPSIGLSEQYGYLDTGDIVRVNPSALQVNVLYRRTSPNNSLLVTEQCNSFCVMCSQPPRKIDDSHIINDVKRVIELADRGTESLGITGGEPTLLGDAFISIVRHARNYLPETQLHVLTNGRLFADRAFARKLADVRHPKLILGIPLYSNQADIHDFVVQADNAYNETIKGILNLKENKVGIELRVVLHRETYSGLPDLAKFIARNLTFVDCVALMGLELVGFAKSNIDALWIDPYDYQEQLKQAVLTLDRTHIPVYIYNHQLCIVPEKIRPYCVKSISDWKNEYLPICQNCSRKTECGGFFSTGKSLQHVSEYISPL